MVAPPWHKALQNSGSTPPVHRAQDLVSPAADAPAAHASQAIHTKRGHPDPETLRASRHTFSCRSTANHVHPIAGKGFFSRLLGCLGQYYLGPLRDEYFVL